MYAIIVITNSFASYLSYDELAENLRPLLPRPIISVSAPLNLTGNKYTRVSSNQFYTEIVDYLVYKYNRRRIGFFSAALTQSKESGRPALRCNPLCQRQHCGRRTYSL